MASRSDTHSTYKAEVIAAARSQIARRIARFCTALSSEQFENLLDRMVHIHWKYDILPHIDPHIDPSVDPDHKSTTQDFLSTEH